MKTPQKLILKALDSLGKVKMNGFPRGFIILLMLCVLSSILLYLGGWCWCWYFKGAPDLPAMALFIDTITKVPFIAAIGFLAKASYDINRDGVMDYFQQKEDEDAKSNLRTSEGTCRKG
ncbi:MAG: hypothetical protein KHX13_04915 [Acidaminococcus intestini]|uniref:Uncharacterized protein n=1 Tax=Acidaminococcus intestini TaxID=187327 RepID=A0A943EGY8_9FIRM|nr:hypothetical protein [Acidaminococcus intestini]